LRHRPKFGRFYGSNPEAWIFQVERYFDFYRIELDEQLTVASFYLDGEALEIRFKQKGLESAEGWLAKLRQVTTVSELQGRFQSIANETDDISERHMKGPVRPALANKGLPLLPSPNSSSYHNPSASFSNNPSSQALAKPPIKRLTHAEIQSRRERDLCYYCEEKFTAGHKCKSPPQLLLLTDGSDMEPILPESFVSDDILAEELQVLEVQEQSAISYHALAGGHSSSTLRFIVHVNGAPVQVLVDGGSDHNFVQTRVAKFHQLTIEIIPAFSVMVGSGQRLRCEGIVRQVPLTIHECNLTMDFYVLPMHGANVVLWSSWLSTLGRVVTDYAERLFEFNLQGMTRIWKGESPNSAQPVQLHSLRRYAATNVISSYYCLQIVPPHATIEEPSNPELLGILREFVDVFQKP
ncbi:hypothetical protein A4A49_60795, partial [Nicotiana attenuata]